MNDEYIYEKPIEGINKDLIKMVVYDDGKSTKWAIKNRYGKTTQFFDNSFYMIRYNDSAFLFIGETNGKREIYGVTGTLSKDEPLYNKIDLPGDLIYLEELNDYNFIVTTDKGEYLFNAVTLKQSSDIFNSLATYNNRLVFRKDINHDGNVYSYFGQVSLDGSIRDFLYDDKNDLFTTVPLVEDKKSSFDIIDENKLESELDKITKKTKIFKKSKMNILFRLNMNKE